VRQGDRVLWQKVCIPAGTEEEKEYGAGGADGRRREEREQEREQVRQRREGR